MSEAAVCANVTQPRQKAEKHSNERRWAYRINYGDFITYDKYVTLDLDVQVQYISVLCYLGVRNIDTLAECLSTDQETAKSVAVTGGFYSQLDRIKQLAKDMHLFEDGALGSYEYRILVSIRRAVDIAQTLSGDRRLLDGLRKVIKNEIDFTHRLGRAQGSRHPLCRVSFNTSSSVPSHYPTSSKPNDSVVLNNAATAAPSNKGDEPMKELYGMAKVIGKPIEKMDLDDIEKAVVGCPFKPSHDRETILTESFLRQIFFYFPHIQKTMIARCLLPTYNEGTVAQTITKKLKEYGITHTMSTEKQYRCECAAFISWATDDLDAGLNYYIKREDTEKERVDSMRRAKSRTTREEEEDMSKKPDQNDAETVVPATESSTKQFESPTTSTESPKINPDELNSESEKSSVADQQESTRAIVTIDSSDYSSREILDAMAELISGFPFSINVEKIELHGTHAIATIRGSSREILDALAKHNNNRFINGIKEIEFV
jgi:hypothetical protein